MKKIALASVLATAAISVQAQTYGEIGYTSTTFKETVDGFAVKASPSAIRAILGYELNPNLAVEGMVAIGTGGASIKVNDVSIPGLELKIENAVGVYLKPKMKLNDAVEVFGRLGYASVKGTLSATGLGSDSVTIR